MESISLLNFVAAVWLATLFATQQIPILAYIQNRLYRYLEAINAYPLIEGLTCPKCAAFWFGLSAYYVQLPEPFIYGLLCSLLAYIISRLWQ